MATKRSTTLTEGNNNILRSLRQRVAKKVATAKLEVQFENRSSKHQNMKPKVAPRPRRPALGDVSNQPGAGTVDGPLKTQKEKAPLRKRRRVDDVKQACSQPEVEPLISSQSSQPIASATAPASLLAQDDLVVDLSDVDMTSPKAVEKQSSKEDSRKRLCHARLEELRHMDSVVRLLKRNPSEAPCEHWLYLAESYFLEQDREDWYERELPLKDFLINGQQPMITDNMLRVLFDWLVEVQENFEMNHESLYLAVKLTYAYLSHGPRLDKCDLQLLATTAMWLASKCEERCPPLLNDFVYVCDDAYREAQFLKMEEKLLQALNFHANLPIAYNFLRRYCRMAAYDNLELSYLSRYLLEYSLLSHNLNLTRESTRAAAALWLARQMLGTAGCRWPAHIAYLTGHSEEELFPVIRLMHFNTKAAPVARTRTIYTKYSNTAFREVAKTPLLPDETFALGRLEIDPLAEKMLSDDLC